MRHQTDGSPQFAHSANVSTVPATLLRCLTASLLALSACNLAPSVEQGTELRAWLSGADIVPRVHSTASGTLVAGLNRHTQVLTYTLIYGGLTRPPTAVELHGPAAVGQLGRIVHTMGDDLTSPVHGKVILTPRQMADLQAGQWTINLRSQEHPDGEIRGQLTLRP